MFTSQTQLHIPSPVRIAGVDVGQVVSVQRASGSSNAAVVTMDINKNGLPIHANANARIRPRLFVEGNFYVDLFPGTPERADAVVGRHAVGRAEHRARCSSTACSSALTTPARTNLQTLLQGFGASLDTRGTAAANATQDPSVRGLTGGQALNESLNYSVGAFRASAIVNQALLGQQPHDLSGVVQGNEQVLQGLCAEPATTLSSLVHTFNATMATLASRQQDLSQTISLLPPLLRRTEAADTALDTSFGPTQQFAKTFLPGVKQLDPTIGAALPWIAQAKALVSKQELGGLLADLTPAVQNTGATIVATPAAGLVGQSAR